MRLEKLKENDDSNRQQSPIREHGQNCHMQTNNYCSEGEEVHSGYDELEDKATLWVHSNVFNLSQHSRECFTGCERLACDMLMKIVQKRFF